MLLLRYLKSYLPAHSILRGFVALHHLCDFADAIRAGCAEAKTTTFIIKQKSGLMQSVRDVLRQRLTGSVGSSYAFDAIRAGCAEAKHCLRLIHANHTGCNPCGMFRNERKVIVFKRSCAEQ